LKTATVDYKQHYRSHSELYLNIRQITGIRPSNDTRKVLCFTYPF